MRWRTIFAGARRVPSCAHPQDTKEEDEPTDPPQTPRWHTASGKETGMAHQRLAQTDVTPYAPNTTRVPVEGMMSFAGISR